MKQVAKGGCSLERAMIDEAPGAMELCRLRIGAGIAQYQQYLVNKAEEAKTEDSSASEEDTRGKQRMEVNTDPDMLKSVFWRKDGQKISKLRYNSLIDQWVSQKVAKCSCENDMHRCPATWGKGHGKGGQGGNRGRNGGWEDDWDKGYWDEDDWDMDDWDERGPGGKDRDQGGKGGWGDSRRSDSGNGGRARGWGKGEEGDFGNFRGEGEERDFVGATEGRGGGSRGSGGSAGGRGNGEGRGRQEGGEENRGPRNGGGRNRE